jgi:CRP/FNR family cyclic AMP-dependent transcriptional regulator
MGSVAETRADHTQILAQAPIFSGLTEAELGYLVERVAPRHYSPGEMVFGEGEPCAGLYVVERGHVRVFKTSAAGREQVLTIDGPGSSVAEIPVFDGGPYPASGAAVDDVTLLFIGKQELSFTTVRHRLVSLLCRLAQREGRQTTEGLEFSLPASHQELASQIGTVRELVSRNLSRLQADGLLKVEGRTVVVRDLKLLEAELEGGE